MVSLIRPLKRLDEFAPEVANEADVEIALANELAWIENKLSSVNLLLNTELGAVRKKYLKHFQVDADLPVVEGESPPQTLEQRYNQVVGAVVTFAKNAKDALLEGLGKIKTREFTLGSIGYKLQPEKLLPAGKKSLNDCLDNLAEKHGLNELISVRLREASEDGHPIDDLLKVSFAWNAERIKQLFAEKKLTKKQLATLGLKIDRDEEKVIVSLK